MTCLAAVFAAAPIALGQTIYPFGSGTEEPDWREFVLMSNPASRDCTSDRAQASAERAITVCTQIIESNVERKRIASALVRRGDRYADEHRSELANADYRRAVELYGADITEAQETPAGYVGRAAALYRLDEFEQAITDLDTAIRLDGAYAQAYYSRAIVRFRVGDYARSIVDYDRAAQLGQRRARRGSMQMTPDHAGTSTPHLNPAVHAGRCIARAAAGVELDVARTACRDATRRSGSTFARGFLNFTQGDFEQAWADFAAAVADDETNGYALYGRGVAAIRLGRQAEGLIDIARARELEGEHLIYYANAGLRP